MRNSRLSVLKEAQSLKEMDLDRKIDVRTEDELGRLAGTLNQAFERLQRSFNRKRRFAAEASHYNRFSIINAAKVLLISESGRPGILEKPNLRLHIHYKIVCLFLIIYSLAGIT